jgi:ferric-dicitrate binding protein FerR (iron transport regulator)
MNHDQLSAPSHAIPDAPRESAVLTFFNTPLEEVMVILSSHYRVTVRNRSMIRGERLTGEFADWSLDEILLVIYQTMEVKLYVEA